MMIRSHKNNAHRLLAMILLLWGLVSESRAQEIEIKAEFRPSLLKRGQDGFQNKTESTGICAKTDVNSRNFQEICKTQGLFSIALQGEAIQQEDIPEGGDARKALYFKWPRKENILLQNQQVGTEKKTANFTITNMSATYLERFTGLPSNNYNSHFNTNYTTEWWRAWENGDPENSTAPCKATYKGLGITQCQDHTNLLCLCGTSHLIQVFVTKNRD